MTNREYMHTLRDPEAHAMAVHAHLQTQAAGLPIADAVALIRKTADQYQEWLSLPHALHPDFEAWRAGGHRC